MPASWSANLPRFARGFVVSDAAVDPPFRDWLLDEIAGLWISRAPDVALTTARSGRRSVVVLGHLVDTEAWCSTEVAVVRAAEALARSEGAFIDATDAWSGRYIVIFGDASGRQVMTDATGLRAAFYALEGLFVLASHAAIVATMVGAEPSSVLEPYRAIVRGHQGGRAVAMAMPGRSTPWSGVVHLTANVALDIGTRSLRRVCPRRPAPPMTPAAAAAVIAPRLQGQVTALAGSGRPVAMSITAGVDSRVSLAASRPVREGVRYFTYRRADLRGNAADVALAGVMARSLGLSHRVLDVPPIVEPPELDAAMREASFLIHGRRLVPAYRAAFTPQALHIRSNVAEVGRCYYRRTSAGATMATSPREVSASDLARLWAHVDVAGPVVEAFDEWMDATRFRDAAHLDPLDLFYWEHRMSCWHSNVVLESDFAFDTHVLFNSRWILERMLSVPAAERARGSLFRHLIAELWPDLAAWPIDPGGASRGRARRRTLRSLITSARRRIAP